MSSDNAPLYPAFEKIFQYGKIIIAVMMAITKISAGPGIDAIMLISIYFLYFERQGSV